MAFNINLWKIENEKLVEIEKAKLGTEERLENWIEKDPSILGIDALIIGRQVATEYGGRIDLLGINNQGELIILELKRDKTPREIVAQVLDYASWIRTLTYSKINAITEKYQNKNLPQIFAEHYNQPLPENINTNHSMVIVAAELDESSERIVEYLSQEYNVNINAIFFNFFIDDQKEFLGRAWLLDPEDVQERSESRKQAPWTGVWFVNVGEGPHRNWKDNIKYGFIGAGQGPKYSRPLKKLTISNRLFAYMKGLGYVGYGEVTKEASMIKDFEVNGKKLLEQPLKAPQSAENSSDPELSEWVVGIKWLKTFERSEPQYFKNIFANQNIVCKLRDSQTLEFLENKFEVQKFS